MDEWLKGMKCDLHDNSWARRLPTASALSPEAWCLHHPHPHQRSTQNWGPAASAALRHTGSPRPLILIEGSTSTCRRVLSLHLLTAPAPGPSGLGVCPPRPLGPLSQGTRSMARPFMGRGRESRVGRRNLWCWGTLDTSRRQLNV